MRIFLYGVAVIVVGLVTGISTGWYEVEMTPRQFTPTNQTAAAIRAGQLEAIKLGPKVEVEGGLSYDFGTGQRHSRMTHTFVVHNRGDEPLTLNKGSTSCKCTLSDLKKGELAPGESAEITLEWTLSIEGENFRQTAEIYTNDPRSLTLALVVQGQITDVLRLEPRELVLSDVSTSEGTEVGFSLYGYGVERLEIVEHRFENAETADFFALEFTEAEVGESDLKPKPSTLLRATLSVKPGLPLGSINQTIHLTTNVAEASELVLPISGSVVGDISIVGAGMYRQDRNLLMLGQVESEQGIETTVRVLIKGPHRHEVRPEIKEVDPSDVLAAQVGDGTPINNGAVYMYPLTISVPKGARTIARMGSERGEYGRVVIATNHPDSKLVTLFVRFAVK